MKSCQARCGEVRWDALGLQRNDVVLARGLVEPGHALDCHVVGLGRARGENNLASIGPDQVCDLLPACPTPTKTIRTRVTKSHAERPASPQHPTV
jgi:hypothetical protein